jgi:hypothetical protein
VSKPSTGIEFELQCGETWKRMLMPCTNVVDLLSKASGI